MVVSHLWVLGPSPGFSIRGESTFNHWAIFLVLVIRRNGKRFVPSYRFPEFK